MNTPQRNKGGRPSNPEHRSTRGVRLTDREWATLQALGGATWLRSQLKRARPSVEQAAARDALLLELMGQARLVE